MKIRDRLETKNWYWFTIRFDINPLPWHWQVEFTNYIWGYRALVGPVGVFIMWPDSNKASGDFPRGKK